MWGAHGWDRVLGCAPLYIPQTSTPPWAWLCLSFPPATGTTRAFPAVLFGARRFRIPRGTKGPRYPHHPHTSTPRARMLPWGLIPHHWDPPHPVPRPGMPQQHFGVSPSRVPPAPVSPVPYRRRRFSSNCSMVTSSSRTKSALPNSGPSSSAMPRPPAPTSPLGCAGGFLRRQRPAEPAAQAQGDREHPLCHCHRHLLWGWRQPNLWPSTPRVDIDHHRRGGTCGVGAMGLLHPAGAPWCPQICHCTKNPVGNQLFIEMVASPVVIPVSPVKRLV